MRKALGLLLASAAIAGCYTRPAEGAFPCDDATDCPPGWFCRADELCWSTDDMSCPAGQHFEASVDACREDLAAPVVHLEPAAPRTLDDLVLVIDTPTVETLRTDAGPITYQYAWTRDASVVAGETSDTLGAALTTRDEVWAVTVTPITDDGLEGPAAAAMVTIANTPPTLRTVGLSSYAPIVGETLQMIPGPATDDDGDPISFEFEWEIDGAAATTTTAFLTAYEGDASVLGRAAPTDGTDVGMTSTVGPITTLADVTRWRALLPQREIGNEGWVFLDEPNDRLVIFAPTDRLMRSRQVWEYPLHGDQRYRELFPSGMAPQFAWGGHAIDTVNHRVLMIGGGDRSTGLDGDLSNRVFALELTRGAERWVEIHPAGDPPPPRFGCTAEFDAERERVLIVGGLTPTEVADDVWALDTSTVGAERWTLLANLGTPLFQPTLVRDEQRDRWLVLAYLEDADAVAFEIRDEGTTRLVNPSLPSFLIGSVAMPESDGEHAVIAFGQGGDKESTNLTQRLDLRSATLSSLTFSGDAPDGGTFGIVMRYPEGGYLIWGGRYSADRGPLSFYHADVDEHRWDEYLRDDEIGPPALQGMVQIAAGNFVGGLTTHRTIDSETIWSYRDNSWRRLPVTTTFPTRYAVGTIDMNSDMIPRAIFGGLEAMEVSSDDRVWTASGLTDWGAAPGRMARYGVAVSGSRCATAVSVGGRVGTVSSASVQRLDCDAGCTWTDLPSLETALGWPAATYAEDQIVEFGGLAPGGADGLVRTLRECDPAATWTTPSVGGPSPDPRFGHTMTTRPLVRYATLLIFGGALDDERRTNDVWQLRWDGTSWAWSEVTPPETGPSPRAFHLAWIDGAGDRLLVYGGQVSDDLASDLWELRLRP